MIFCKLNRNIIQKSCLHNGNNTGKDAQLTKVGELKADIKKRSA